jgi:hypothetical protein
MKMKFLLPFALALAAGVAGAALPAAATTVPTIINIGTYASAGQPDSFYISDGAPTDSSITADFAATIKGSKTAFDDIFTFELLQNGLGSGSLSTSFSGISNELDITEVLINGVSYALTSTTSGESVTANDIAIVSGVENTIEVIGTTLAGTKAATYSGTATFTATSAAPEPATWLLMIGGIGMVGAVLRRRTTAGAVFA